MNKDIKNYIEEYEMICYQIDAYEKQINDLRIILDKKIEMLEEQIAYFKAKFEREIEPINDKINECQKQKNRLALNHKIKVRLGDIINEISSILKITPDDIKVFGCHSKVSYPPFYTLPEKDALKYAITHTDPLNVYINMHTKNKDIPFFAHFDFENSLSDVDAKGKMLVEHSKKRSTKKIEENGKLSYLVLLNAEELEDIFCSFNLKQIIDFKGDYENDVLSKAVINFLNRQKIEEKEKQKTLHI